MHGMRPFGELVPKERALEILLGAALPTERIESVPLVAARGRVLAEDAIAEVAVPPFDRSMMDGYAVRAGDALRLRIAGGSLAGAPASGPIRAGEAFRIATGARVPEGADAVVRVEDTSEEAGFVTLRAPASAGRSIERAGNDLEKGAIAVAAGSLLSPARLGVLASIGRASAQVYARPRVAILTTGDELMRPGDAPRAGAIFESNGVTLRALIEEAGGEIVHVAHAIDDAAVQRRALAESVAKSDLAVVSGGASVGARDLVVDVLRGAGELLLHGVRVKPGKPLLAGRVGRVLVVGLPGNPTSALSNAALFVVPALRRIGRLPTPHARTVDAALAEAVDGERERFLFLPVRLAEGRASPTFKGSGALTSLSGSDGWIGVEEGASLAAGTRVVVHLW